MNPSALKNKRPPSTPFRKAVSGGARNFEAVTPDPRHSHRSQRLLIRRQFLAQVSRAALAALAADRVCPSRTSAAESKQPAAAKTRRLHYIGWQVGITYQAPAAGGLGRDDLMRLLDEMARHRMNLLSLMMLSYGYYDPNHDGYCWPVTNPKLKLYWDDQSLNGQPATEFVREVIVAAAQRGIEVQLMMNWGIWNPDRIRRGYPDASVQERRTRSSQPQWLHCPDSPGSWQAGLDEVADLLTFYAHPNVSSYMFERLSYDSRDYCFCPHTRRQFQQDTGKPMPDASADELETWRKEHITAHLTRYVEHIHRVRPKLGVALHTQCATGWGHDPKRLGACGFNYLAPHTFQFRETRESFHRLLDRLSPNPCVLHFCSRDVRPQNYALWIKTPEIIAEGISWVLDYPGDRVKGIAFFNPTATSPRNRQAVYEQIKRFQW
jgi:hypothetical protein